MSLAFESFARIRMRDRDRVCRAFMDAFAVEVGDTVLGDDVAEIAANACRVIANEDSVVGSDARHCFCRTDPATTAMGRDQRRHSASGRSPTSAHTGV